MFQLPPLAAIDQWEVLMLLFVLFYVFYYILGRGRNERKVLWFHKWCTEFIFRDFAFVTNELDISTDPRTIEAYFQNKKESITEKKNDTVRPLPSFYRNSYSCYQVK